MELVPEAVQGHGNSGTQEALPALVERGLTAQLVLQSLVTGMLQVELDFRPGVKALRLGETLDLPEIPTVPSPFQALTDQLQTLDIAAAVTALQRTLASMDALLTSPALKQTIDGLPALLADLRQTVKTVDREVHSFSATGQRSISETAASLQNTLASVQSWQRTRPRGGEHAHRRARHFCRMRTLQSMASRCWLIRGAKPQPRCRTHWATSRQPRHACAIYQSE